VKGSTAAIRRSLKEGLLGDAANVRAGRFKPGPFESLRTFPEFRDLVLTPPDGAGQNVRPTETVDDTNTRHSVQTQSPPKVSAVNSTAAPLIQVQQGKADVASGSADLWRWLWLLLVALVTGLFAWYFLFRRGV
jgi:hypothetical protein